MKKILFLTMAVWLLCSGTAWAQEKMAVQVSVTDLSGEPLPGATVVEVGTRNTATADVNGKCTIMVPVNATLEVSFMGYATQQVAATRAVIEVQLDEEGTMLDEVVMVGFQSQKKVNLTAAVSNIDAKTFENRPVSNIGQALIGASPGLNISIDGGSPSQVPNLNIRGATTIRSRRDRTGATADANKLDVVSGNPLILLDGIEISNEDLNQINPADIDNISLLKDASAAAIYGTRATFGVVLVQTKSGAFNQKAKIDYSYDISWDKPVGIPDILDSYTIYKAGIK